MDEKITLRKELRNSINDEIEARTKLHQTKIAGFKTALRSRIAANASAPPVPLAMLAHGDSLVRLSAVG